MGDVVIDNRKNDHPIVVEKLDGNVKVFSGGNVIVDTDSAVVLKEKGMEDVIYYPIRDVKMIFLLESDKHTKCPYKGQTDYYHLSVGGKKVENAVWRYLKPTLDFLPIKDYVAFDSKSIDKVEKN
jgi:Uncharacterized protein conserved in bacteria